VPPGLLPLAGGAGATATPKPVLEFARKPEAREHLRNQFAAQAFDDAKAGEAKDETNKSVLAAAQKKEAYDKARRLLNKRDRDGVQTGKLGVDLALQVNNLRTLSQVERSAIRNVMGRNCLEVGGVWIDDAFTAKTDAVVVKAQSDAYFRILEKHPEVKRLFQLGNHLVWVTPSGKALVIDASNGKEKLSDDEIKVLFAKKK
jgi:Ca-activated chloride channel family protein